MKLTEVTHERLDGRVAVWRRRQREAAAATLYAAAEAYRQCANDLELALRDDASLQELPNPDGVRCFPGCSHTPDEPNCGRLEDDLRG